MENIRVIDVSPPLRTTRISCMINFLPHVFVNLCVLLCCIFVSNKPDHYSPLCVVIFNRKMGGCFVYWPGVVTTKTHYDTPGPRLTRVRAPGRVSRCDGPCHSANDILTFETLRRFGPVLWRPSGTTQSSRSRRWSFTTRNGGRQKLQTI